MTLQLDVKDREYNKFAEDSAGNVNVRTLVLSSLIPQAYDYISLSYTGNNITTIVYKTGGAGGKIGRASCRERV